MNEQALPANLPVTMDRNVMSGAAVFRGTRVPVQSIFDYLIDGYTLDQFLDSFPTVHREDALTVLEAAGQLVVNGAQNR